ncbi:MAG: hydrogenase maturation protease [Sulfuricaulis sp.]|nr:hydrogenase maturation protease [Sulfuricaulis sp.]
MNSCIQLIGVGSPFSDDRLGWVAAEALQRSSVVQAMHPGRMVISILDRPGAMLLAHWRDADNVILIDAVHSGAAPGTLHCLTASDLASGGLPASSHGFGIACALELGGALGNLPGSVLLYGIEIDPAHVGQSLSAAVLSALPDLIRRIEQVLSDPVGNATPSSVTRRAARNGRVHPPRVN